MNISPRKIGRSLHPLLKKEVLTKVYRRERFFPYIYSSRARG
jgi:hypothetical protein